MTKKLVIVILGSLLLILLIGIIIPKLAIKNPDLRSSPCAQQSVKAASKFPLSLIRTVKVERFTITSVDMSFYTLFSIKLKYQTGVSCTLGSDHAWTKYENVKLGFSLEYPSDLLKPQEGGVNEPGDVSFIKDPNAYEKIQVDVYPTNFADIWSYIAQNPLNEFSTTTEVAGAPTITQKDSGGLCPECVSYLFFAQGNKYMLNIDLPAPDAARVVNSFQVLTASPVSTNWPVNIACQNYQNYNFSISCGQGLYLQQYIDGWVTELTFFDKNKTYYVEGGGAPILFIGVTKGNYNGSIEEYLQGHSTLQLVKQTTLGGQTAYNLTCKPHVNPCENDSVVFYKGNTYLFTNGDNMEALPTYDTLIGSIKFN